MNYKIILGATAAVFCVAVALVVSDHSMREEMRSATINKRNIAFTKFLAKHGRSCVVVQSEFGGPAVHNQFKGDVWSVRCEDKVEYALLLGDDPKDQTWFITCGDAQRIKAFRCFAPNSHPVIFH